jgi:hypothetical protein
MQTVTRTEYLAELNRQLQLHPDYLPVFRFVTAPEGSEPEQASGYSWVPYELKHPFVNVAHAVLKDFIT